MHTEINPTRVEIAVTVGKGHLATTHTQLAIKKYNNEDKPKWEFMESGIHAPVEPKERMDYLLAHIEMCKAVMKLK